MGETMPINDLIFLSNQLNTASDKVTDILRDAEDQLRDLNLGYEATAKGPLVPIEGWDDEEEEVEREQWVHLVWGKDAGKWRLLVRTTLLRHSGVYKAEDYECITESVEDRPVGDCSRTLRFAAIERLDDLVAELKRVGSEMLEVAERSAKIEI